MEAEILKDLTAKRISMDEYKCARAKSFYTPCVVKTGDKAMSDGHTKVCVGCGADVEKLLAEEKEKHEAA